jgi:lysylphosphatidylglycerol synthetase-like protein (DUF2156 family)
MPSLSAHAPKRGHEPAVLPAIVSAATGGTADARLWRRRPPLPTAPIPLEVRIGLLRQYGSFAYAYATALQPDLERFGDEHGFLAYKTVGGTALVLSDPIAPRENYAGLIARFVAEKRDVCFWCVSRPVAEVVAQMNYFVNEMGPDQRIDLGGYDFNGRGKRNLRKAIALAAKRDYTTRECSFASLDLTEVTAVSEAWRRTRTVRTREISFLNRPIVLGDEEDVRKFFTFDSSGKIVAFGFFDPVYQDGRTIGYAPHVKRRLPDADPFILNAMMCHAMTTFQREGIGWMFTGLAPFADIPRQKDNDFKRSWWVWRCFRTAYKNPLINRFVYPFQNLHEHKRQYRGAMEQTYYATSHPSLRRIFKLLSVCRILG